MISGTRDQSRSKKCSASGAFEQSTDVSALISGRALPLARCFAPWLIISCVLCTSCKPRPAVSPWLHINDDLFEVASVVESYSDRNGGVVEHMDQDVLRGVLNRESPEKLGISEETYRWIQKTMNAGLRFHTTKGIEGKKLKTIGSKEILIVLDYPKDVELKGITVGLEPTFKSDTFLPNHVLGGGPRR